MCSNLLAYADDIVLLAPSWHGLQQLLNIISVAAIEADLCFNTKKTVTMIFNPHNPHKRLHSCLLYTSPSPRDRQKSRMPSSA